MGPRSVLVIPLLSAGLSFVLHAQTTSEIGGCAAKTKGVKVIEHKDRTATSPASGKALICVIRISKLPLKPPAISISANNKWVGEVRRKTYFCFDSEPGLVTLCAKLQGSRGAGINADILALTVAPEQRYYLQAEWPLAARLFIRQLEQRAEDGGKGTPLTSLKFLTFQ